jgi:hypothetical protein
MNRVLAVSTAAIALAGCGTDATLMRYASDPKDLPAPAPPKLFVSSAPADASDPLTFKALPERAQAEYISVLGANEKDPKKLRASLAEPLSKGASAAIDRTKFSRVMVVGLQRTSIRPGDRYLSSVIEIKPEGNSFEFSGYKSAATAWTTVNIGTVSISNQTSTKAEIDPKFGGTLIGTGSASVGVVTTNTANRNISDRQQFSVDVLPDKVTIYQTGTEGIDLTGDALISLTVRMPPDAGQRYVIGKPDLREDDGTLKKPDKVGITFSKAMLVPPTDLYVCARVTYVERVVDSGSHFYDEGRQTGEPKTSPPTPWTPFRIVPQQDVNYPLWAIGTPHAYLSYDDGLVVREILFDDYELAEDFAAWLKRNKTDKVGKYVLREGTRPSTVTGHANELEPIPLTNYSDLNIERFRVSPRNPANPLDHRCSSE